MLSPISSASPQLIQQATQSSASASAAAVSASTVASPGQDVVSLSPAGVHASSAVPVSHDGDSDGH